MRLTIKNLGNIQQADIDIKDLTIICGPNGANKTWFSYAIYHYFDLPKSLSWRGDIESVAVPIGPNKMTIDISSAGFFRLLVSYFDSVESLGAKEVYRTFNASQKTFEHFSMRQSDAVPAQRLSHQKAEELVSALIKETINYSFDDLLVSSIATDNVLSLTFKIHGEPDERTAVNKRFLFSVFIRDMITTYSSLLRPFAITSERVGCLAFQKDIDGSALRIKNRLETLLETFSYGENTQVTELIQEMHALSLGNRATVPVPVRRNLEAVRHAQEVLTKESYLKTEAPALVAALREITRGSFAVNNGVLNYTYNKDNKDNSLPVAIASSSIKSLFHLDLYINHLAKKNDILLIDEPELNLHPDNQRKMASVIARLVNAGVKVLLTTHSDYLLRELNNYIMLSSSFGNKSTIMADHHIVNADILKPKQVSAYTVDTQGAFAAMEVGKLGINTQIFDNIINRANQLQSEIYYSLEEDNE